MTIGAKSHETDSAAPESTGIISTNQQGEGIMPSTTICSECFQSGDDIGSPIIEITLRLLILHGTSRGWTVKKIAMTLPASQTTVKSFRAKIFDDPALVFELPVLVEMTPKSYQCRLCGESRGSRVKAMRHVLAHILPEEMARGVPLEVRKPL